MHGWPFQGLPPPSSTPGPSPRSTCPEAVYKYHQALDRRYKPTNLVSTASHCVSLPPVTQFTDRQVQYHGHQQPHPPHPFTGQSSPQEQPHITLSHTPEPWHRSEEFTRSRLQVRVEEEKAKQEAEKARQESLRLEQRRIELDMLRETFRHGAPTPMLPQVFGGGTLPHTAAEFGQTILPTVTNSGIQHSLALSSNFPNLYGSEYASKNEYFGTVANLSPARGLREYGQYPESARETHEQMKIRIRSSSSMFSDGRNLSAPSQGSAMRPSPRGPQADEPTYPVPRRSNLGWNFRQWQHPAKQSRTYRSDQHETTSKACIPKESEARYMPPFSSAIIGEYKTNYTITKPQRPGTSSQQGLQVPLAFTLSGFSDPFSYREEGHKRRRTDVMLRRAPSYESHRCNHPHRVRYLNRAGNDTCASSSDDMEKPDLTDKKTIKKNCILVSKEDGQGFNTTRGSPDSPGWRRRWSQ